MSTNFVRYFNKSLGDADGAAARFGDWKIITGYGCTGSTVWQEWPELSDTPVSEAVAYLLQHGE